MISSRSELYYMYGLPMTYVEFAELNEDYKRGYLIKLTETLNMKNSIIASMFLIKDYEVKQLMKKYNIKSIDSRRKQSDSIKDKQIRFLSEDDSDRFKYLIDHIRRTKSINRSKNNKINGMEPSYLLKIKDVECFGDLITKLMEYTETDLPDKLVIEVTKKNKNT